MHVSVQVSVWDTGSGELGSARLAAKLHNQAGGDAPRASGGAHGGHRGSPHRQGGLLLVHFRPRRHQLHHCRCLRPTRWLPHGQPPPHSYVTSSSPSYSICHFDMESFGMRICIANSGRAGPDYAQVERTTVTFLDQTITYYTLPAYYPATEQNLTWVLRIPGSKRISSRHLHRPGHWAHFAFWMAMIVQRDSEAD